MKFVDFVCAEVGTRNWCVAPRLGSRMAATYDLAIPPKRFNELEREWQRRYAPTPEMLVDELVTALKPFAAIGNRKARLYLAPDDPIVASACRAIARAEAARRAT